MDKSYRIHTNISKDTVLNVNMKQDFEFLEVLSLKLAQKDAYKIHSSNYGVIVGRVLANDAFGIPNAKVSIFIERDNSDTTEIENIYPYNDVTTKDRKNIRYNLLPDYSDDECYRIVGTFPNKRLLLDDDTYLEVYEKYWKYTTVTNNAGDYMIFGIPTGSQQIHTDIDLSDIGILSQKPRDFLYKGYNMTEFDNANQFKSSTNLDNLRQIISQNKSVFVYPFWGDIENGIASITRCDVQVDYKFEPTCIFMGAIISDNEANAIGHKCAPAEENGMNNQLVAGEGTIEMIRKTVDGLVEEYQIQGNRLIDSDGVWCYQIPMNLDYIGTDEYGNIIPTDNPNKGIPTRTQVRFRFSKTETGDEGVSRHTAKYLVPMNPPIKEDEMKPKSLLDGANFERLYNFGSNTPQSCFRDLYWNNVYSVKNYIPKVQVAHRPYSPNYGSLKGSNITDNQNPIPFNKMQIEIPFMYMIVCILFTIVMVIIAFINATLICPLNAMIQLINNVFGLLKKPWPIKYLFKWIPDIPYIACVQLAAGLTEGNVMYLPGCYCGRGKDAADCDPEVPNCRKSENMGELLDIIQENLALQYNVVKLDFHQDWVNGCLYMPLWYWRKRKKKTFLFGLFSSSAKNEFCDCDRTYSRLKTYFTCDIPYSDENLTVESSASSSEEDRWHRSRSGGVRFPNGLIKGVTNKDGLTAYYYVAMQPTDDNDYEPIETREKGFFVIRLYATDIILLGNLNEDNLYGIPQFFKVLPSTTANIPPIASIEESLEDDDKSTENNKYDSTQSEDSGTTITNGMVWRRGGDEAVPTYGSGLLLDLACTYADTKLKSCINVERLSELGVNLDMTYNMSYSRNGNNIQRGVIEADGFITKYELDDMDNRAMFATLNHIGFVPQAYQDSISGYTTQVEDENTTYLVPKFRFIYPTDFDGRMDEIMKRYQNGFEQAMYDEQDQAYLTFRLGGDAKNGNDVVHGRMRHFYNQTGNILNFPLYNNSFYFYFGINKGNTAIDKFNNLYMADCVSNDIEPFSLNLDKKGKSYCQTAYNKVIDSYGYIKVELDDIQIPYSYTLYDSYGEVVIGETNMTALTFTIGDVSNDGDGKVKYQDGVIVENEYGLSGLTNQTYNLVVMDDNGKKVNRRIELSMPTLSLNYASYKLGTKFYDVANSPKEYICDEDNEFYGRIEIDDIIIDGMDCPISSTTSFESGETSDDGEYVFKISNLKSTNGKISGGTVYLHFSTIEAERYDEIKECLCGEPDEPRVSVKTEGERSYIQFDVYKPKRYMMELKQCCAESGEAETCTELEENKTSEIVKVPNGENFNTFLNTMPTRFMLGTNNDTSSASIANGSYFYRSEHVSNATDEGVRGWFGVHQEDTYRFNDTVSENEIIWEDFIKFGGRRITDPVAKLSIIDYKFDKMFSLSNAVYVSGEFRYTSVGGVQPTLYRSVTPYYGNSRAVNSQYVFGDTNYVTVTRQLPNIIGKNYAIDKDSEERTRSGIPTFNDFYDDNTDKLGNYFAAFTNDGGYINKKTISKDENVMRSPSYASVSPRDVQIPKPKGKQEKGSITSFPYVYNSGNQTLDGDKSRTVLPYLRALTVDRRLDYDLTFIGPAVGTKFNLYEHNNESKDMDKLWKSARVFGTFYNGIEMSYDEDYNIISAETIVDSATTDIISASANTFLEYSYSISSGETDAITIYNEPTDVFWERDLASGYTPTDGETMNKRFYEASLLGVDIRDYFWSTFNKNRLSKYVSGQPSYDSSGYTPYVFSYPSGQTSYYNGDFNRDDAVMSNKYPTRRYIDVCNIMPMGSYSMTITPCSYGGMRSVINEDSTITAEAKEGEGIDVDLSFENPIRFTQYPSEKNDVGNVEYSLGENESGYTRFNASVANLYFTLNKTISDEFDVYTALPRVIKVLPYIDGVDGITYFKTATPTGEIKASKTVDEAINDVTLYKFDGGFYLYLFGIDLRDVILPDGISIETNSLIGANDQKILDDFSSFWEENSESFITTDNDNFDKIAFRTSINLDDVKVFSILVDKYCVDNSNSRLTKKVRTIETSELFDARDILMKFVSGTESAPLSYVEAKDMKLSGGTEEIQYIQTTAFEIKVDAANGNPTSIANQAFASFDSMSFTLVFDDYTTQYQVGCQVSGESENDNSMIVRISGKWTPEMGTLLDSGKQWRCYLMAKTSSGFSYKIGPFMLSGNSKELPEKDHFTITEAQIII